VSWQREKELLEALAKVNHSNLEVTYHFCLQLIGQNESPIKVIRKCDTTVYSPGPELEEWGAQ
jgi:hypothetical protein